MNRLFAFMLIAGGFAMTSAKAISAEIEVGQTYVCSHADAESAVLVWIGKVEPLNDAAPPVSGAIISVSMQSIGTKQMPSVGHAPISAEKFGGCRASDAQFPASARANFDEGYATWRAAYDNNEAGYWTLSPSEVYAAILGVIEQ
jgi:hypothetical protein